MDSATKQMVEKLNRDMLQTFLALVTDIESAKVEIREIRQREREASAGLENMKTVALSIARIMDERKERPSDEVVNKVMGNRAFSRDQVGDYWTYQKLLERVK
jgi:uncharacterized membrane protein YgaE (UPF0421/DUF939 family)